MTPYKADISRYFEAPPSKWLTMLEAYLDESGHEKDQHVFVAGFVGSVEQWKACEDAWRNALGKRKAFHITKLRWNGPTSSRTKLLLEKLGPIPKASGLEKVVGGVRVQDYANLIQGSRREKLYKGYYAALNVLLVQLLRWVPPNEKIKIFFEEQKEYAANTTIIMNHIPFLHEEFFCKDGTPKLSQWGFLTKDASPLTQPADYFAFGLLHLYQDSTSRKTEWCRPMLGDDNEESIGRVLDKDEVREIMMNAVVLGSLMK